MNHATQTTTKVEHIVTVTADDIKKWLQKKEGAPRNLIDIDIRICDPINGELFTLDNLNGLRVTWTERVTE